MPFIYEDGGCMSLYKELTGGDVAGGGLELFDTDEVLLLELQLLEIRSQTPHPGWEDGP